MSQLFLLYEDGFQNKKKINHKKVVGEIIGFVVIKNARREGKHEDYAVVVCLVARERGSSKNSNNARFSVEEDEEGGGWCAFLFFFSFNTFAFSIGFWITRVSAFNRGRESKHSLATV